MLSHGDIAGKWTRLHRVAQGIARYYQLNNKAAPLYSVFRLKASYVFTQKVTRRPAL
jgi:hypothetical protein